MAVRASVGLDDAEAIAISCWALAQHLLLLGRGRGL
jgi:hypothetical protein